MAISRARKEELVAEYTDLINSSQALFLAEYGGMNVKSLESLRDKVREAGGLFYVTKNTLLKYALEQNNKPVPADLLEGQVGTGFAQGEAPALAKVLIDFAKTNEFMNIKGGVMDKNALTAEQVEALANLPSLDQLRAQIIGLINAPAQYVAGAIASGVRQVINVIDAYAKSEENAAEAA